MSPQTAIRRIDLTYEDYVLFPEDGKRHEIIDGDHYVTPAPNVKHQRVSFNLSKLFAVYLDKTRVGLALSAPCDVVLSDRDVVQPDLLFVSKARAAIVTEKNIQGPPDLVVEIVSETTRKTDEVLKRHLYERHGVQEYWIVDPEIEAVKVYRTTENGYVRAADLTREAGESIASPLLPGLDVPLAELFAD